MQRAQEKTIGEIAESHGMSLRTLRFYEQIKMLKPRRDGLVRYYSEVDATTIAFIQRGKKYRLSLRQIADLLSHRTRQSESPTSEEKMAMSPDVVARQLIILRKEAIQLHEAILELENY